MHYVTPKTRYSSLILNVPFGEKDEAKALGARWDPTRKKWYIDAQQAAIEAFTRWVPR